MRSPGSTQQWGMTARQKPQKDLKSGFLWAGLLPPVDVSFFGTNGGVVCRINAQLMPSKKGWALMSSAPALDPNRLAGSRTRS